MPFTFTDEQLANIAASARPGSYYDAYRKIAEYAAGQEGVDAASIVSFEGACDENQSAGVLSQLICAYYTDEQRKVRYGTAMAASARAQGAEVVATFHCQNDAGLFPGLWTKMLQGAI